MNTLTVQLLPGGPCPLSSTLWALLQGFSIGGELEGVSMLLLEALSSCWLAIIRLASDITVGIAKILLSWRYSWTIALCVGGGNCYCYINRIRFDPMCTDWHHTGKSQTIGSVSADRVGNLRASVGGAHLQHCKKAIVLMKTHFTVALLFMCMLWL